MLSIKTLRETVDYDPITGSITWRPRAGKPTWNSKYVGKEALPYVGVRGYRQGTILGVPLTGHKVAYAMAYGEWPTKNVLLKDRDLLNLRKDNLVHADRKGSTYRPKKTAPKNNTSGFVGVQQIRKSGKWKAIVNGIYVGQADSPESANEIREAYLND